MTLIGFPPIHQPTNQSLELVQEADELVTLTKEVLSPFFSLKPRPTSQQRRLPKPEDTDTVPTTRTPTPADIARETGASVAEALRGSPSFESVVGAKPTIPHKIDRQLLYSLRQQLATQDVPEQLKRKARASFWKALAETNPSLR